MYLDIEKALVAWLADQTDVRCATDTPPNLAEKFVKVVRVGGTDDALSVDKPVVDIECFATTRGDASDLARKVQRLLRFRGETSVTGGWMRQASTVSGPALRPQANPALWRFGATYQIPTRSSDLES